MMDAPSGWLLVALALAVVALSLAVLVWNRYRRVATITLDAGASDASLYAGMVIKTTSASGQSQIRRIVAYNGATRTVTVGEPWTSPPRLGDEVKIE